MIKPKPLFSIVHGTPLNSMVRLSTVTSSGPKCDNRMCVTHSLFIVGQQCSQVESNETDVHLGKDNMYDVSKMLVAVERIHVAVHLNSSSACRSIFARCRAFFVFFFFFFLR